MKERTTWIAGGVVVAGLVVAAMIALGHGAARASAEKARRFAVACEAAGFAPAQCVFLAELDRRTSDASLDAAMASAQAMGAAAQAAMPR